MNYKEGIEQYIENKFTLKNLIFLTCFLVGVFGFFVGYTYGIYHTTEILTEAVNNTANDENSILELYDLSGNVNRYNVNFVNNQPMNLSNFCNGD